MDGYELVEDLETGDYSWSAVGVWRKKADDTLWWARDFGCSCNGPWEDMTEADLMSLHSPADFVAFAAACDGVDTPETDAAFREKFRRLVDAKALA